MPDSKRPASGPPSTETFRQKALKLCALANETNDPLIRAELESLAFAYMQLAEKAEHKAAAAPARQDEPGKPGDD